MDKASTALNSALLSLAFFPGNVVTTEKLQEQCDIILEKTPAYMRETFEQLIECAWRNWKNQPVEVWGYEDPYYVPRLAKAIYHLKRIPALKMELLGSWLWVDGVTTDYELGMERLGFNCNSRREKWYMSPSYTSPRTAQPMQSLRSYYGSAAV